VAKIDDIDLGYIRLFERVTRKQLVEAVSAGAFTYWQNLVASSSSWRIIGVLDAEDAASTIKRLQNLHVHGLPVLIDLDDLLDGFIAWGRVAEFRERMEAERSGVYQYELVVNLVPGIGVTYLHTGDAELHDLDYRAAFRAFDPVQGRFGLEVSADRLVWTHQFYLDNDASSIQDLVFEVQVGDDINGFRIYAYKEGAWRLVGDWGGADSWGATKSFIDENAVSHDFTVDHGTRGEALTHGTISRMPGLIRRVLIEVSNMQAQSGNDYSIDYGSDQLLLKVSAIHAAREALRPLPLVTYVDGSFEIGRA